MKNLLQKSYFIFSLLFIVSCANSKIEREDKPDATITPNVKTDYDATRENNSLKKGCELMVFIKGIENEGELIIRIKDDFSPQYKKVKRAVQVKALGQWSSRFEILTKNSEGHQKRIVTNDESKIAFYKKRGAEVNQVYGDSIRYMKYPDDHEEMLHFSLPTKRMARFTSPMFQKRMFLDVFNFSYSDFFHSVVKLVDVDEIQFGREMISVKERRFKEVSPGIFFWLASD